MNAKLIPMAVAAALSLAAAGAAVGAERVYRLDSDNTYRLGRAPDWNVAAADGMCRLRIWVDDRARVQLRGDQIIVNTENGRRAFDQGSVCNQPLPAGPVADFHVEVARGRGTVMEVREPERRNGFTGGVTVVDPQNGGDTYELVMAWHNLPAAAPPVALNAPSPYFDEARACQDRVRAKFLDRNRDVDASVDFNEIPVRDELRAGRERIRGNAWARNRTDSRPITYECVMDDRGGRVLSAQYDVADRRVSSLQ